MADSLHAPHGTNYDKSLLAMPLIRCITAVAILTAVSLARPLRSMPVQPASLEVDLVNDVLLKLECFLLVAAPPQWAWWPPADIESTAAVSPHHSAPTTPPRARQL